MRRLLLGFWLMGSVGFAIGLAQEQELLGIKRVFVEQLNGGDSAYQIRDLIVSALQNSKLFVVTENRERADVVMRGSAGDTESVPAGEVCAVDPSGAQTRRAPKLHVAEDYGSTRPEKSAVCCRIHLSMIKRRLRRSSGPNGRRSSASA